MTGIGKITRILLFPVPDGKRDCAGINYPERMLKRRCRFQRSTHRNVNPVQFPADEGPEGTVFIRICEPYSEFLHSTVTPDRCQSCCRTLPCFGQFVLTPEEVDKDTHSMAASQVLQPLNRTAPDLWVVVPAAGDQ